MNSSTYFKTGPHHVLCKLDEINDATYPATARSAWDDMHVKLPCAQRKYPTEPDHWPEIVQGLSAPILTIRELTDTMLRWNKRGGAEWNFYTLEAFLNGGKPLSEPEKGISGASSGSNGQDEDGTGMLEESQSRSSMAHVQEEALLSDKEAREMLLENDDNESQADKNAAGCVSGKEQVADQIPQYARAADDEGHMYLSNKETVRFFDIVLPRMQQLALRLPELIKIPIPLLMQQQDSAITLSQEQIACLLSHAFFNTFPGRWVPFRHGRRRGHFKKNSRHKDRQRGDNDGHAEEGALALEGRAQAGKHHQKQQQQKKPAQKQQRSLFDYFTFDSQKAHGSISPSKVSSAAFSSGNERNIDTEGLEEPTSSKSESNSSTPKKMGGDDHEEEEEAESKKTKPSPRKLPSINFISLFHAADRKSASSNVMFAKLRCLFHYFDRVTRDMPEGTVTYHRQVLQKPVDLKRANRVRPEVFQFSNVTVDIDGPLEDSPLGTLQLDFANKNLGGGALERGAVQEEIRFMICPELILTRLFTEQLQMNEALLIKGCERFSNYNGYSKTFEWHSDHRDQTPRDALGRRKTEICAIDATPFKSRASKLEQFSEYHVWRELNKALVGFRVSPILADEWGLAKERTHPSSDAQLGVPTSRPIATGNWGCGAFGGNVHLKFVLQLLAASVCGAYAPNDGRLGHDVVYYAYGLEQVAQDIEKFMEVVEASQLSIESDRIMQCIVQYPRKNNAGEITGLREKNLLEYLASALGYVKDS